MLNIAQAGYAITATVRSQDKANEVLRAHPEWKDKVNFAIIADFTSAKPFDNLFQSATRSFNYVIHTASPMRFQVSDIRKEMVEPAELGLVNPPHK